MRRRGGIVRKQINTKIGTKSYFFRRGGYVSESMVKNNIAYFSDQLQVSRRHKSQHKRVILLFVLRYCSDYNSTV